MLNLYTNNLLNIKPRAAAKPPKKGQGEDMKKYNVIHVSTYSGKETIIRKNVSLFEANEAFYGIDNTYIIEVDE